MTYPCFISLLMRTNDLRKIQILKLGIGLIGMIMFGGIAGCGQSETTEQAIEAAYETGTLSFGTGTENSMVHQAGIAIAGVINNTVPGIHAAVETTKGSMINATNISEGDLDLALVYGDVAYDAFHGLYGFEGKTLENLRVLGACYQEVSGWMALEKTELKAVHDLKGAIISSGPAASSTELASYRVFELLGINGENTEIYTDSLTNSVEHIKRETADAVHAFSIVPFRAHEALAAEYETKVLEYTTEELEQIVQMDERYFITTIPAETYRGQEEAVPTFGIKVLLCASDEMDEDLAYEIAKALDLNGPVYTGGHRFMASMQDKSFLCNELPIPLHAGAEKYYQEVGFIK